MREINVAEQRYQGVLAVLQDGLSVTAEAERMGVSRQTLHRWLAWYAAGGIEELVDRSHRPHGCPHQMASRSRCDWCSCVGAIPAGAQIGCAIGWQRAGGLHCRARRALPGR